MKKSLFLLPLLGLLSIGCVSEKETPASSGGNDDAVVKGYLSVNLVAPGGVHTRAYDDYLSGSASENYVKMVRFYFFDNAGEPVYVSKNPHVENDYYSFYDWDPSEYENENADSDVDNTVEKILSTTVVITSPEDYDVSPTMVMAIINPTDELIAMGNLSKSELNDQIKDYKTGLLNSNFVMSNSVYIDGNGNQIDYTLISDENIAMDIATAKENAIVLFVERVVARLDFAVGGENVIPLAGQDNVYDTGVTFAPEDDASVSEKVYVKFLGWNITSTPTTSRLVKSIDATWANNIFGDIEPWNSNDFHRSFWAINPEELAYDWCSYDEIYGGSSAQTQLGVGMDQKTLYMQENANPYETVAGTNSNPEYPTKVIVAAQLVNAAGQPVTIAEYNQQHYTLSGLMTIAANKLYLYTKDGNTYTRIKPDQLTLMTRAEWSGKEGPDESGSYYVYFTLTDEASQLTWYSSPSHGTSATDDYTQVNSADINQFIYDSINRAMVWNNGATYYFFNIRHLGALGSTGYYGVVRNHIYNATVTKVAGLGTPVYDPSETIYPEEVDNSGTLLAAKIEILQWRLVDESYEFSW